MTLEQFHYLIDNTTSYGIQDLVDATKTTNKLSGQTQVFTTAIDRGTSPKSEYQWFNNGVPLNSRDTASNTLTVSRLGCGVSGDYY
ncbi:hypothetical protein [Cyclobacterium plantarum]|uniref:Ig-like domain-containing protein n=1 Tax=Cyclobacterium plantarum TaxID=2716263 RepID=A0ABX0HD86_9BACT|nr:hypothetical protein [Cyclobacterium plantarum]NHE59850.1 hypothetical protein [Cyclobacterium plantarum]